jgi:hypothetical protein
MANKTDAVHALQRAEYAEAVVECALPVICVARGIGITTGQQLAQFLNRVGVLPFQEPAWTKNSANRAVEYLVKKKRLVWPRHRGKRSPFLEALRKAYFVDAVKMCRKVEHGAAE